MEKSATKHNATNVTALLQTSLLDLTSRGGDKGRGRERDGRGENMGGSKG